jgi:hypothetical protein
MTSRIECLNNELPHQLSYTTETCVVFLLIMRMHLINLYVDVDVNVYNVRSC